MIIIILSVIVFIYADFAVWYTASINNIFSCNKKRKYKGLLSCFWDKCAGENKK